MVEAFVNNMALNFPDSRLLCFIQVTLRTPFYIDLPLTFIIQEWALDWIVEDWLHHLFTVPPLHNLFVHLSHVWIVFVNLCRLSLQACRARLSYDFDGHHGLHYLLNLLISHLAIGFVPSLSFLSFDIIFVVGDRGVGYVRRVQTWRSTS